MKKVSYFNVVAYAILGLILLAVASLVHATDVGRQAKTSLACTYTGNVGISVPIKTDDCRFKGNPNGAYAGTAWDPDGTNTAKALSHQGIIVFYKNHYQYYGDFYMTANMGNDETLYKTVKSNEVVHCANGATVEGPHNSHLAYSPNIDGMYDGSGHYWCSMNGTAVDPLPGPETNKALPDLHNAPALFKVTVPDGTNYYKLTTNNWTPALTALNNNGNGWVTCPNGFAGPYVDGDATSYWGQADRNLHYHCTSFEQGHFVDPIAGNAPPSTYNISIFPYSQSTCAAGDATCGGANTYGATTTQCSIGTYWCQTTDPSVRYCSSSPCTSANFVPPTSAWTIGPPTNLRVTGTKTGFALTESVPVAVDFAATGTSIPYGSATVTVQISQDTTFGTVWNKTYTATPTAVGSSLSGSLSTFSATGTYYWRAKVSMGTQESGWTFTSSPFTICASGLTWNGTICTSSTTTTTTTTSTCALSLVLNDNKTIYTKGVDWVNYTYTCSPAGTRAANVTVQVVKPDGIATTYNSGTNIDTASMGFDTTNLTPGVYTLRACLSSTCTTGVSSVNFTVSSAATTTTTTPTTTTAPRGCAIGETCSTTNGDWCSSGMMCYNASSTTNFTCYASGSTCPGSTTTTPTTTTIYPITTYVSPKACSAGEVCTSGSWCSNGRQCYYADSSFTCSANWQDACPSGTTTCNPTDTNCIDPGKYGPLSGWCSNSSDCYTTDGKKYCQPYSTTTASAMSCPAGTKMCAPSDSNCIEAGGYGSLDGWCRNSTECYTADGKQKYCQQYSYSTAASTGAAGASPVAATAAMATYCPAGFKQCRPSDANCIETGASGPSSGWCAGSSKQCFLPDGKLYCAKMDESCPAGAGVCRASDTNCIEPGKYGPLVGWCGGSASVQCYKNDGTGTYCNQINSASDASAWEKAVCPSGTSRCRYDDKFCLELGKTGPSGSWCSAGMSYYNTDGSITCLSTEDYNKKSKTSTEIKPPVPPKEEFCMQVPVVAYDSATLKCGVFATACNVPEGWTRLGSEKVCKDGMVIEVGEVAEDFSALGGIIENDIKYLQGLVLELKRAPFSVRGAEVLLTKRIQGALAELTDIQQALPPKTSAQKETINKKLNTLHKITIPEIDSKMQEIQPYVEFVSLKIKVRETQKNIRIEMTTSDPTSEYYFTLKEADEKFENLLKSAETQTGQGLTQLVSVIKDTKSQIESLIGDKYKARKEQFYTRATEDLVTFFDTTTKFIEEKRIYDHKVTMTMERLDGIVSTIKDLASGDMYAGRELPDVSKLIDEGMQIKNQLSIWLNGYGFAMNSTLSIDSIMANVEASVTAKVNEMFAGLSNKMQLMLDDAMQKVAVKVAEMVDKFSATVQEKVTQSVSNLTYIVDKHREAMVAAKNNILDRIDALQTAITQSHLRTFETDAVKTAMDTASTLNWCGNMAENVQSDISRAGLALEVGQPVNVTDFVNGINTYAAQNPEECYKTGVSSFKDTPTHEWYFGPAQYNTTHGLIRGYSDPNGNPNGSFGPANPTLRIEALAMVMRMLNLPTRDGAVNRPDVPAWGAVYYNGALDKGIIDTTWKWNQPISRLQTAQLLYKALLASGKNYISAPTTFTAVGKYPDQRLFGNDPAVESLTDIGIFQGAGSTGNFNPGNNLLRSEFAAVNQRVEETLGITAPLP